MSPLRFYRDAYSAITDFGFYSRVLQQPFQRTLAYLGYIVLHSALICTLAASIHQLPWIYRGIEWAQQNFPTLVFEDGRLSLPEAEDGVPIIREYLGQSVWTYVFDPKGQEDPYKVRQPAVVLNPEKCLLIVDPDFQLSWNWKDVVRSAVIDRQSWAELGRNLHSYFWVFSVITLLGFYALIKPAQALLITFFSTVGAVRLGMRLPFLSHFSICVYALTPAIVIDLLLQLVNLLQFPEFFLIYIATAAVYAYRATQVAISPS